jgi:hypothetical protein
VKNNFHLKIADQIESLQLQVR